MSNPAAEGTAPGTPPIDLPPPDPPKAPEPKPNEPKPADAKPAEPRDPLLGSVGQGVAQGSLHNSTQTINQIRNYTVGEVVQGYSVFDWKSHTEFKRQEEEDHARNFACDPDFIDARVASLLRDRVLIVHGEAGTGKVSLSLYLADRLHQQELMAGRSRGSTMMYQPPRNNVKFDLFQNLKERKGLNDSVLIFRNVLDYGNPWAVEFLSNLKNAAATANVAYELSQRNTFIIFTVSTSSLPDGFAASVPAHLFVEPKLSPEMLLAGVRQAAAAYLSSPEHAALRSNVTPELEREIADRCKTMSRASRFIGKSLAAVLRGETPIEKAFAEADLFSAWFQRCPEGDTEAWSYCLALVVAHSRGRFGEVYFSEFASLYGPIRRHILRWRGIRRPQRPLNETVLRERAGAGVTRDASSARVIIAFEDSGDATRLWSTLTQHFQSLLISLVPALQRLTQDDSVFLRAKAAQALGRIGLIDPPSMTLSWLKAWAESDSWRERALAGYLAQGVLSTGDEVYREHLLGTLERFAADKRHEWTAVVAYKEMASIDLPMALSKLRVIAESRLAPAFQAGRDISRALRQLDAELARVQTLEAALVREFLPALGQFYASMLEKENELAITFKYTLVSLCLSTGFPGVIGHLTSWALGSPGMQALICLVFLQEEGIASELSARKMFVVNSEGNDERITCNAILASITGDSEAIRVFAEFLKIMYAGLLNFFPLYISAPLTRLIFDYLKQWVRESLPLAGCRAAMVELTARLLRANLKELRDRTFDWLSSDPDMLDSEIVQFAREARFRAMSPL